MASSPSSVSTSNLNSESGSRNDSPASSIHQSSPIHSKSNHYNSNSVSTPAPSSSPFYRTARHVRVEQTSQSIKGTYRISPLAPDVYPPLYDLPKPDPKAVSSAEFETRSSAVNVELLIGVNQLRDEDDIPSWERGRGFRKSMNLEKKERVGSIWVNAKSHHGAVRVKIPEYSLVNPLSLRLKSSNGTITLVIPPSFSGVISWKSESGTLKLSPKMQTRWKALGNESHKRRGVGRVGASDERSRKSLSDDEIKLEMDGKRGDSAELITKLGNIYIEEAGEEKGGEGCSVM